MITCGSFSPTIEALSDSHRTAIYGFCHLLNSRIYLTCFNAQNSLSVGATRFLSKSSVRVKHIVGTSAVFEVACVVVASVSVFVVDVVKVEGVGDKGFCD